MQMNYHKVKLQIIDKETRHKFLTSMRERATHNSWIAILFLLLHLPIAIVYIIAGNTT